MPRMNADEISERRTSRTFPLCSALLPQALKAVRCAPRHPEQKKYMLSKEATFATSSSEGKGIRMIIDYLREEKPDAVRAILDEKPAFTTGMEKFEMDVHDQQLDYLSDDLGIKMNDSEDAVERYAVRIQLLLVVPAGGSS